MKRLIKLWRRRHWRPHARNPEPHPALRHLRITFRVAEYEAIIENHDIYNVPKEYWARLPNYIIARCPFCHAAYTAKLDTHSLAFWYGTRQDDHAREVFREAYQDVGCAHFLAVHSFLNLNGFFPEDAGNYFHNTYDVPFVSPLFLPDEVPSYVVMHSLPVCRIEEGEFVPRYGLYTLTYYVPEEYVSWKQFPSTTGLSRRGIIHERRVAERQAPGYTPYHWEGFLYPLGYAKEHPEWWDLRLWVERKKLLWLDPYSPDLQLRDGPVDEFPYANIQGYRRPIEIRKGTFRFQY